MFDNIFNILVVIVMVSIVSGLLNNLVLFEFILGIIIDTFSKLRTEENEKNKDINDKCFMCGVSKLNILNNYYFL